MLRTSSTALSFEDLVLYIYIPISSVTVEAHVVIMTRPTQSFMPNDSLSLAACAPRLGKNKFGQKVLKVANTLRCGCGTLAVRIDRRLAKGEVRYRSSGTSN